MLRRCSICLWHWWTACCSWDAASIYWSSASRWSSPSVREVSAAGSARSVCSLRLLRRDSAGSWSDWTGRECSRTGPWNARKKRIVRILSLHRDRKTRRPTFIHCVSLYHKNMLSCVLERNWIQWGTSTHTWTLTCQQIRPLFLTDARYVAWTYTYSIVTLEQRLIIPLSI